MAKREVPAAPKKRAPRNTAKSDAAGKQNLAKGRATRDAQIKAARARGALPAADRWAMLLDGTLTIRDLDDEEVRRGRVRGKDGGFAGKRRPVPSHLMHQFQQEAIRRAKDKIGRATAEVTKELLDIARDADVPVAQRIKVLMYLQDRQLGKAPETIRVEGASEFDKVTMEALGLDREMADLNSEEGTGDDGLRSRGGGR